MNKKETQYCISERIREQVEKYPKRIALQIKRNNQYASVPYSEMWDRIQGTASCLQETGLEAGDKVALFADSSPDWIIAYFGIHLAGCVVVPIDAQYGAKELTTLLDFADARAILVDPRHAPVAETFNQERKEALPVWKIDTGDDTAITQRKPAPSFQPQPPQWDDVMSIIFTSGTTGEPKGVQLTTGNISSNVADVLEAIRITAKDNILNILPLHHAYASTACAFTLLSAGATITFSDSMKGPDLVCIMNETRVTILPGVPQLFTLLHRAIFQKINQASLGVRMVFHTLYRTAEKVRRMTGLRIGKLFFRSVHKSFGGHLRCFASGGAKLDPKIAEDFLNLGILTVEGYGLTETAPVLSFTPLSHPKPGSVGIPMKQVELDIANADSVGQGEIRMRGPNLMKGYYKNPKATAEVIRDGWFYTGDLGRIEEDGMLTITGRAKEVIVLPSGKNIYPDEVEAKYQDTIMVKEICILPRKASDGTLSGLTAVVVPDAEEMAARKVAVPRERILQALHRTAVHLPSYMHVNDLVLLSDTLPRTRLGKLRRAKIEELVQQQAKNHKPEALPELDENTRALMEHPRSLKYLKRLEDVTGKSGPFLPGQDMEIDLGLDSLTLIQITAMMEQEFATTIPDEEMSQVRTVGDLLERVVHSTGQTSSGQVALSWSDRLAKPAEVPLEERFNLYRGFFSRLLISVVKIMLWVFVKLCFRIKLEGKENIPKGGKVLICPNHQSYLDAILVFALVPRARVEQMLFIASAEIFAKPPLTWVIKIARIVLTGAADSLEDSLKLAAEGFRRDMAVCIFPEGARTNDGNLLSPRPGAGILSNELDVPIVPVLIDGSFQTMSPKYPKFRPCVIRMVAGNPINPKSIEAPPAQIHTTLMQKWEEQIIELKRSGESHE